MEKNKQLSKEIIKLVGGKENIKDAYHCMTRLRLLLKDMELADLEKLGGVQGVIGMNNANGELQIIIGPGVNSMYPVFIEEAELTAHGAIDENLDQAESKSEKIAVKGILGGILDAFSACISPIIPLLIVTGVFNLIAILLGPGFFGVIEEEDALYSNFYYVSQAILYFLPMFVAYTASRYFKCSTVITMAIAAFMLYPNYLEIVSAGEAYTYFGLPVNLINYNSAILPLMLVAFVQTYVEKFLNKYVPDVVKVIIVPSATALIMMPLSLCVLGPVMTVFGNGLNAFLVWLYEVAGPIETMLVGAVAIIGVAFGFLRPVYFTGLMAFLSTGVDYTALPMLAVFCNFVAMGATTGYMIKVKSRSKKQFAGTCLVSGALGGVSEPSIFGIYMLNRVLLITTAIGGAVTGLLQGILKIGYFQRGTSNIFGVLSFVSPEGSANLINALICSAVGFGVTLMITLILYKDKEKEK